MPSCRHPAALFLLLAATTAGSAAAQAQLRVGNGSRQTWYLVVQQPEAALHVTDSRWPSGHGPKALPGARHPRIPVKPGHFVEVRIPGPGPASFRLVDPQGTGLAQLVAGFKPGPAGEAVPEARITYDPPLTDLDKVGAWTQPPHHAWPIFALQSDRYPMEGPLPPPVAAVAPAAEKHAPAHPKPPVFWTGKHPDPPNGGYAATLAVDAARKAHALVLRCSSEDRWRFHTLGSPHRVQVRFYNGGRHRDLALEEGVEASFILGMRETAVLSAAGTQEAFDLPFDLEPVDPHGQPLDAPDAWAYPFNRPDGHVQSHDRAPKADQDTLRIMRGQDLRTVVLD